MSDHRADLGHRLWRGAVFWWTVLFTPRSVREIEPERVTENTPAPPPPGDADRARGELASFRLRREEIERQNERNRELARLWQRRREERTKGGAA